MQPTMQPTIFKDFNNTHAVNIHTSSLSDKNPIALFSPYSISCAMSLVAAGLDGETLKQLAHACKCDPNAFTDILADMANVQNDLTSNVKTLIRVVNSLYLAQKFALKPSYLESIGHLISKVQLVNFEHYELVRNSINSDVSNTTEKLITELIPVGVLNADTKLVITNALYFKGVWKTPFSKELTRKDFFTTSTGDKINLDFMHRTKACHMQYFEDGSYQAVMIPYEDGFNLLTLKPKNPDKIVTNIVDKIPFFKKLKLFYPCQVLHKRIRCHLWIFTNHWVSMIYSMGNWPICLN